MSAEFKVLRSKISMEIEKTIEEMEEMGYSKAEIDKWVIENSPVYNGETNSLEY